MRDLHRTRFAQWRVGTEAKPSLLLTGLPVRQVRAFSSADQTTAECPTSIRWKSDQRVPFVALGSLCRGPRDRVTAQDIHAMRHELGVAGVHAKFSATEVIEFRIGRNRASQKPVGVPMDGVLHAVEGCEPVARRVRLARPDPASAGAGLLRDLCKPDAESFVLERHSQNLVRAGSCRGRGEIE